MSSSHGYSFHLRFVIPVARQTILGGILTCFQRLDRQGARACELECGENVQSMLGRAYKSQRAVN